LTQTIAERSVKLVTLMDLAGHEKYSKTTFMGLTSKPPGYACVVGSFTQPLDTLKKSIELCHSFRVRYFIVVNKSDRVTAEQRTEFLRQVRELLSSFGVTGTVVQDEETAQALAQQVRNVQYSSNRRSGSPTPPPSLVGSPVLVATGSYAQLQKGAVVAGNGTNAETGERNPAATPPPSGAAPTTGLGGVCTDKSKKSQSSLDTLSELSHDSNPASPQGHLGNSVDNSSAQNSQQQFAEIAAGTVNDLAATTASSVDGASPTAANSNQQGSVTIPMFVVSCVRGDGCDILSRFLHYLPQTEDLSHLEPEILVDSCFQKPRVGLIFRGFVKKGSIQRGQQLVIGPDRRGSFFPVTISTIHLNGSNVKKASSGSDVTFTLNERLPRILDPSRKGINLLDPKKAGGQTVCMEFEAEVEVQVLRDRKSVV
jgi:GTPase